LIAQRWAIRRAVLRRGILTPERVLRVSGEPTKKAAVTRALQEFIARREQRQVAELFGKLEWDPGFDYKAERERQR
jgi:hypothetical protein